MLSRVEMEAWCKLPGTTLLKQVLKGDVEELKEMLTVEESQLPSDLTHAKVRGIIAGLRSTISLLAGEIAAESSTIKTTGENDE